MKQQHSLMKFDPSTGNPQPYPSHAEQWRKYHGMVAWLYNPWNRNKRDPRDIGTDIQGLLIIPDDEKVYCEVDK